MAPLSICIYTFTICLTLLMDNDWTWWDLYTYTNLFHLLIFVIKFSSYTLSLHNCVNIMVIHRISVPEVEQPIILLINFLESPFFYFVHVLVKNKKNIFSLLIIVWIEILLKLCKTTKIMNIKLWQGLGLNLKLFFE